MNFDGPYAVSKIAKTSDVESETITSPNEEFFPVITIPQENTETQLLLDRLRSDNDHLFEKEVCSIYLDDVLRNELINIIL